MVVFVFSGCRTYMVQVDSISDSTVKLNKTYVIASGNKDTGVNDLQFKEFAGLLVKAMAIQGYMLAATAQAADIQVFLSYGIGVPETHVYTYLDSVWGQTGVNIYTQTNQQAGPDNTVTQYTSTYMEPQYGVTGYVEKTGQYTVYDKYVLIDAYDIKNSTKGSQLKEIWKTSMTANGKSKDLRKVFPGLLAAGSKYIGINTGENLTVEVTPDSPELKAIKGN